MPARRREAVYTALAVALILLTAVLANLVARRFSVRLDLTADLRYTLSETTLALLAEADGPITARAYLPQSVPAPYDALVRALEDKLAELEAVSGGRLRVEIRDPLERDLDEGERRALVEEARGYGIGEADMLVIESDRQVRQRVVFGVALLHLDRQAVMPLVEDPRQLDYALTCALRDAIRGRGDRPVVGVDTAHGEPPILGTPIADRLGSTTRLQAATVSADPLPDRLDALLIVAPTRPFREAERRTIDQFLMKGKAVIALLDYRETTPAVPGALVPVTSGLEPVFRAYGVDIESQSTVLDPQRSLPAPAGTDPDGRPLMVHHPLFVIADVDPGHPVTAGIERVVMPMAPPIRLAAGDASASAVVRTGASAFARDGIRDIDPAPLRDRVSSDRAGPFTLAVASRGVFLSAFADADPPAPLRRAVGEARLVVATSGRRMLQADPGGLLFLQNAIDWAVMDTELIALRTRGAVDPPLAATEPGERALIKYANVLGPPLLFLALGLGRRRLRRSR